MEKIERKYRKRKHVRFREFAAENTRKKKSAMNSAREIAKIALYRKGQKKARGADGESLMNIDRIELLRSLRRKNKDAVPIGKRLF